LLYATIFHFLAGAIAGALFKTRTLLLLLAFVSIESVIIAFAETRTAIIWASVGIITVQFGYVVGIGVRGLLERTKSSSPRTILRRIRGLFVDVTKSLRFGRKKSRE
jgi:hypothetical protein